MDSTEEHFFGKIAQKAIIEKDSRVLLVRDPREKNEIWEIPGGRMNVGEEPRAALQREFFEEMGVEIKVHEVVHMEQFIQGNEGARSFVIVYRATLVNEQKDFQLDPAEVSEVKWFAENEVEEIELYPEYKRALEVYFNLP